MSNFKAYGVDAAAYAMELMELAAKALRPGGEAAAGGGPAAALAAAERGATTYGAATFTALQLVGSTVDIVNLGDSGFMIIRKEPWDVEISARSTAQQHGWNFPYQLARVPPALMARMARGTRMDCAEDCETFRLSVCPGDLVLLFTDGFSDNLHDSEILALARQAFARCGAAGPPEPGRLARGFALAAQERALDPQADVPFAREAREHGQPAFLGGKIDDITVVAAWVLPVPRSAGSTPNGSP